jgi:hypothetical protein
MRHGRYFSDELFDDRLKPLYEYIEKYWKKNKNNLATESFDLEECFTLLELQSREAEIRNLSSQPVFSPLNQSICA